MSVYELANGKWRSILINFGIDPKHLTGRHGPCIFCGGRDRFRFDDKDGSGSFYCSKCGSGTSIGLIMGLKGWDFKTAAFEVEKIVGQFQPSKVKEKPSDESIRASLRAMWKASKPVQHGDIVARYLNSRGLNMEVWPDALRTMDECVYQDKGAKVKRYFPAMLATVTDVKGRAIGIHRTYLRKDDQGKADVQEPRKITQGTLPTGSAIRLAPYAEVLGIGEGVETCIAASLIYNIPVWSAINSTQLSKWIPPHGIRRVVIFMDNDPKFGGQEAGYRLAHRLACDQKNPVEVEIRIPEKVGTDFNDLLMEKLNG